MVARAFTTPQATDIYKRLLLENRDDVALNVYVAMCYYKLDYYDVSLEILAVYLQSHPDSAIVLNLKACNHFRLYNGKAAEAELKALSEQGVNIEDSDLIRHNLVVFRNGENALQVLPQLVDYIPEAKLNLVIYYLRNDEVMEAYDLIKDMEPSIPQEYILKGVVNARYAAAAVTRRHPHTDTHTHPHSHSHMHGGLFMWLLLTLALWLRALLQRWASDRQPGAPEACAAVLPAGRPLANLLGTVQVGRPC